MPSQMPNRELSVVEILTSAVNLYLARFECFMIPFLLTNFANGAISEFIGYFMPDFIFSQNYTEEFFLRLIDYLVVAIPLAALYVFASWVTNTLSDGIAVKCSSDMLEGRRAGLRKAFGFALSNLFPLLAIGLMTGILTILGLILFVVPGIIVAVMFGLAVQVVTIERSGAVQSLRRSRSLTAERWGKTFAVLLSVFLITALAYIAGDTVGEALEDTFPGSYGVQMATMRWFLMSVFTSLAQPLHPIALTYLYYSMRIKEEAIRAKQPLQPRVLVGPPIPQAELNQRTPQPKFCFKCGQRLPSDAAYCPQCGARVMPQPLRL